jgi:hypothetical protein
MHLAGSVPVGFNRGAWFGRMFSGNEVTTLHFVTPSYTSGTKGLQRGRVLNEPRSQQEFDSMKDALKGAWVLIGGKSSGWAIDQSAKADARRDSLKALNIDIAKQNAQKPNDSIRPLKEEPALFLREMREAGILGIIQSAPVPLTALYDRALVFDSTMTFERLPELPDIKLDEHQYDIIKKMITDQSVFELEFDIRNFFKPGPINYYSVTGKITGSEYPDEYVILSGHLDSFDAATGAVDCGAGVTSVIEAARLVAMSGAKPKRTMLFIAFAGEEFGLLGAKAWTETYAQKLDNIANVFNRDGRQLAPVKISAHSSAYKDFVTICEPLKSIRADFPFELKEIKDAPPRPTRTGGNDATVFALKGVPTITLEEEDVKGYNFDYREVWHTERDLYTKAIPEYQEHAATVLAVCGLGVANLDHLLSREGMYK